MAINLWFDHEEQVKIKTKLEKFLGEEVPNFLGSPHMHLFYKIIQKLEGNPEIITQSISDGEKLLQDAQAGDFFKVAADVPTIEKDVKEVVPDVNQSAATPAGTTDGGATAANAATAEQPAATIPADAPTPTAGTEPTPK